MRKTLLASEIVFLFCSGAPVEGLQCPKGAKVKSGPVTLFNTFKTTNCSDGSSCISVDVTAKKELFPVSNKC